MVRYGKMKICLQVIAFNVDTWINEMLENAAPHVDKIFIAYPPRPWNYSKKSRTNIKNPTNIKDIKTKQLQCEVEIVYGDWSYDEDTRNALLQKARNEEYDWMIIQDADEFYKEDAWNTLKQEMEDATDTELLITPWINFWKNPRYVIVNKHNGIKSLNEGAAIKAKKSTCKFTYSRTSNAIKRKIINADCYHYGYVMSDQAMKTKINTWAHAKQIKEINDWYNIKWLNWTEETKFLHPSSPYEWQCATWFALEQPLFASHFMRLNNNIEPNRKGLYLTIKEFRWDRWSDLIKTKRYLKKVIRNTIVNIGLRSKKH